MGVTNIYVNLSNSSYPRNPLFLFDVSKQSERVKYSSISIVIEASFQRNVDAGTIAYAVVISDRLIDFQSVVY